MLPVVTNSKMYMRTKQWLIPVILSAGLIILFAGCATHSPADAATDTPGFFYGLLHGFIILFSFIASLFTDYYIYAIPNSGIWYDLGFLLGVMMFFGGGVKAQHHHGKKKKEEAAG